MDLRAEPIVLSVPAVAPPRYYSVMLCDFNTYNYGYFGSRTTGNDAGSYMVTGPDWQGETPKGIKKVFRSSTQFSLAAYRTQLLNADDMDNVKQVQSGYKVQTLSAYLNQPAPPPAPSIDFPAFNKEMVKTHFFDYLDFILQFIPPAPEEQDIRAKLATIGVGMANFGTEINGWNVASIFGDRDFYNGDWLKCAAAAKFGIFGNTAEEALYPIVTKDGNGKPLDASKHTYTLTLSGRVAHSHHSERLSGQRE
jgi:hypothetical protein